MQISPEFQSNFTWISVEFHLDFSRISAEFHPNFKTWNSPEIRVKFAWSSPEIHVNFRWNSPEISVKFPWSLPEICTHLELQQQIRFAMWALQPESFLFIYVSHAFLSSQTEELHFHRIRLQAPVWCVLQTHVCNYIFLILHYKLIDHNTLSVVNGTTWCIK